MIGKLSKTIQILLIGVGSNFSLYFILYATLGSRIGLEFHFNEVLLLGGTIGSFFLIIIVAKILELFFKIDFKQITLISISTLVYTFFSINIINVIKIIYNILTFNDIILSNKFVTIRYFFTKDELISLIPVFHKKITGQARIFNPEQKIKILDKATSAIELKNNLEAFLIAEQEALKSNKNLINQIINYMWVNPYIVGAVAGTVTIIIGFTAYKYYSDIIHWHHANKNIRDVHNQVEHNLHLIKLLQEKLVKILEILNIHDNNNKFTNYAILSLLGSLGNFFLVGFEMTENKIEPKLKINPIALTKLLDNLNSLGNDTKRVTDYLENNGNSNENLTPIAAFRPYTGQPFTGQGYKLGTKENNE